MLGLFVQGTPVSVQGLYVPGGIYVLVGISTDKCPGGKCPGAICPWGKCSGVQQNTLSSTTQTLNEFYA